MTLWEQNFIPELLNLYISWMKTWIEIILNELWSSLYFILENLSTDLLDWIILNNLYFTYENMGVLCSTLNMYFSLIQKWKSRHRFPCMNIEFSIFHTWRFGKRFSWMKYCNLYIAIMNISCTFSCTIYGIDCV